jgi:hypothetical protein
MRQVVCLAAVAVLTTSVISGCGSGVPMGQVTGKVTYNSQPVRDGSLTFSPVMSVANKDDARRPGIATIENGSFSASTIKPGDGLGVGKYMISFSARPPAWEAPEYDGVGAPPEPPRSEYSGLVPKETEIEVKSGANDLTIELVAGQTQ